VVTSERWCALSHGKQKEKVPPDKAVVSMRVGLKCAHAALERRLHAAVKAIVSKGIKERVEHETYPFGPRQDYFRAQDIDLLAC
jgi:hypothetical protein